MGDPATTVIQLEADQEVNSVGAGIAHHLATGHLGGGSDHDYDCNECEFWIRDGVVITGGPIKVLAESEGTRATGEEEPHG